MKNILLRGENLTKYYFTHKKKLKIVALNNVTIEIPEKSVVALVGESGSGKTTLGKILIGIEKPDKGKIFYNGNEIKLNDRKIFSNLFQIIFQDPYSSFNPTFKIEKSILEPLILNKSYFENFNINRNDLILNILNEVGLDRSVLEKYPYELSGGELQRVAFIRAIITNPKIIIADEPASMLDASIRIGILNLINKLKKDFNLSFLFITHDILQALYVSDYIYVIYLGEIMEFGATKEIIYNPKHPYTKGLIGALLTGDEDRRPINMIGEIPSPFNRPSGCVFQTRCPYKIKICENKEPELKLIEERGIKCHLY